MNTGIYFNEALNEIVSVTEGAAEPGEGWRRVSPDAGLRLLAIRGLLTGRGLVTDPTRVYWSMPHEYDVALTNPLLVASCPLPPRRPAGALHRVLDLIRNAFPPISRSFR